ncbi:patatin-like phospholipase family protein [Kaustia mangrovi]|uniref:Patatin-like phospholipase family protein n=1 Tax=Kaustia mangrovi TaxID=2593653 RepID=A0A7S8HB51_9HYPH|nr:patatin-like phospholipase family protein [Kaustia mangrovi]QPC42240.1 patatin-like phospholipase family protein [Kaustia mangrovi]
MTAPRKPRRRAAKPRPVNLALQGGGAHGAFTWGVLDRLLEDGQLQVSAMSGTSAGAMNAVVLADGYMRDGADGAREHLRDFWYEISIQAQASPVRRTPFDMMTGSWAMDASPGLLWFDLLSRIASPYDLNPLNINPLLNLIERMIDFERVRACTAIKLFVTATNVHTGRPRIFETEELTADMVMASACLPHLFQAVEIDGVPYWDGGYMGNPALYPLFYLTEIEDLMLVQVNPIERRETPRTAREIVDRVNEITFNAALMKELRSIEFVTRLIDEGKLEWGHYKRLRLHRIDADDAFKELSASTKFNAEWDFLTHLRDLGRDAASQWLKAHASDVGKRSSVDIRAMFD